MNKKLLLVITLIIIISSCKRQVTNETLVYNNDFENNNLAGITNGILTAYNNSTVLGRYNNGYFSLLVNNLPKHSLITVTLDLYIHDSWDGNKQAPDGPDIWELIADDNTYLSTTFSNDQCNGGFCS